MRFNYALVSIFLFVPRVLADYHLENHQPRYLSKRDISDDAPDSLPWSGAFMRGSNKEVYNSTTGTFSVPSAWDGDKTGVSIFVGVGTFCKDHTGYAHLVAGVDVYLINNTLTYAAGSQWGNQTTWSSVDLGIAAGHFIRATVHVDSATTGFVTLENLSTNTSWAESFVEQPVICQQSAEWIVEGFTGYPMVPKFSTVTFVDATATGPTAFRSSVGASVINMEYDNTTLTSGMAKQDIVVVVREM